MAEELTINDHIYQWAKLGFSIDDTAKALSLEDEIELFYDKCHDYYKSFNRGQLEAELTLRKTIFSLAKAGSSPAQAMVIKILNIQKINSEHD